MAGVWLCRVISTHCVQRLREETHTYIRARARAHTHTHTYTHAHIRTHKLAEIRDLWSSLNVAEEGGELLNKNVMDVHVVTLIKRWVSNHNWPNKKKIVVLLIINESPYLVQVCVRGWGVCVCGWDVLNLTPTTQGPFLSTSPRT